jgi:hypothetical protein
MQGVGVSSCPVRPGGLVRLMDGTPLVEDGAVSGRYIIYEVYFALGIVTSDFS